jgi:hypothetical protein
MTLFAQTMFEYMLFYYFILSERIFQKSAICAPSLYQCCMDFLNKNNVGLLLRTFRFLNNQLGPGF